MPKTNKLHPKGKPKSIQKTCKENSDNSDDMDPEQSIRQFQLELCWCIQQLERSLSDKKGSEKQLQETWKVLTVLKNNNQPMIRKRQLMRTHFGDYRAKMAAEEKKLVKMTSKIKIAESPQQPKATYLRKSAFLSTGDSSFRFNFNLLPEQLDSNSSTHEGNDIVNTTNTDNNIVASTQEKTLKSVTEDNSKKFKFTFSDSEFKFNFDVNNS